MPAVSIHGQRDLEARKARKIWGMTRIRENLQGRPDSGTPGPRSLGRASWRYLRSREDRPPPPPPPPKPEKDKKKKRGQKVEESSDEDCRIARKPGLPASACKACAGSVRTQRILWAPRR